MFHNVSSINDNSYNDNVKTMTMSTMTFHNDNDNDNNDNVSQWQCFNTDNVFFWVITFLVTISHWFRVGCHSNWIAKGVFGWLLAGECFSIWLGTEARVPNQILRIPPHSLLLDSLYHDGHSSLLCLSRIPLFSSASSLTPTVLITHSLTHWSTLVKISSCQQYHTWKLSISIGLHIGIDVRDDNFSMSPRSGVLIAWTFSFWWCNHEFCFCHYSICASWFCFVLFIEWRNFPQISFLFEIKDTRKLNNRNHKGCKSLKILLE
jgi:hypothetical protein